MEFNSRFYLVLVCGLLFSVGIVHCDDENETPSPSSSPSPSTSEEVHLVSSSPSESPSGEIHFISDSPTASESISTSASQSPSPSVNHSHSSTPTPTSSPAPKQKNTAGKEAAVVVVSFILVSVGAAVLVFNSRRSGGSYSGMHSSGLGYKSPLGVLLWTAALVGFATAGSTINYDYKQFKPFATSYVKFLVASDVLSWLFISGMLIADFIERSFDPKITLAIESLLSLFSFCAAVASTAHFNGDKSFCKYDFDDSTCTTYQSSIFFTWVLFFGLGFKACLSAFATRESTRATI